MPLTQILTSFLVWSLLMAPSVTHLLVLCATDAPMELQASAVVIVLAQALAVVMAWSVFQAK